MGVVKIQLPNRAAKELENNSIDLAAIVTGFGIDRLGLNWLLGVKSSNKLFLKSLRICNFKMTLRILNWYYKNTEFHVFRR